MPYFGFFCFYFLTRFFLSEVVFLSEVNIIFSAVRSDYSPLYLIRILVLRAIHAADSTVARIIIIYYSIIQTVNKITSAPVIFQ